MARACAVFVCLSLTLKLRAVIPPASPTHLLLPPRPPPRIYSSFLLKIAPGSRLRKIVHELQQTCRCCDSGRRPPSAAAEGRNKFDSSHWIRNEASSGPQVSLEASSAAAVGGRAGDGGSGRRRRSANALPCPDDTSVPTIRSSSPSFLPLLHLLLKSPLLALKKKAKPRLGLM